MAGGKDIANGCMTYAVHLPSAGLEGRNHGVGEWQAGARLGEGAFPSELF